MLSSKSISRTKIVVLILALCAAFALVGCGGSGLTLADYDRLYTGMSHSDAMEIMGSYASRSAETGSGEFLTVIYSVEGSGSTGANASVTFQGSPLTLQSKAQMGLR